MGGPPNPAPLPAREGGANQGHDAELGVRLPAVALAQAGNAEGEDPAPPNPGIQNTGDSIQEGKPTEVLQATWTPLPLSSILYSGFCIPGKGVVLVETYPPGPPPGAGRGSKPGP